MNPWEIFAWVAAISTSIVIISIAAMVAISTIRTIRALTTKTKSKLTTNNIIQLSDRESKS